jgi:hypothetical protein
MERLEVLPPAVENIMLFLQVKFKGKVALSFVLLSL